MNKHHMLIALGLGIAAGYFMSGQLSSLPLLSKAYAAGQNSAM